MIINKNIFAIQNIAWPLLSGKKCKYFERETKTFCKDKVFSYLMLNASIYKLCKFYHNKWCPRAKENDVIMYSKHYSIAVSLLALTKYVSSKHNICRNKHLHIIISVITYSYQFTTFSTCENTLFIHDLRNWIWHHIKSRITSLNKQ